MSAFTQPWLIPLAALVIWADLYSQATIKLDYRHAIAMKAMWGNHDGQQKISEEKAMQVTNANLRDFDFNELNSSNFANIIDQLENFGCVEINSGEIRLREWIRRKLR